MQEREDIMKDDVNKYLEKRRFKRISVPPEKIPCPDEEEAGPSDSGAVNEITDDNVDQDDGEVVITDESSDEDYTEVFLVIIFGNKTIIYTKRIFSFKHFPSK